MHSNIGEQVTDNERGLGRGFQMYKLNVDGKSSSSFNGFAVIEKKLEVSRLNTLFEPCLTDFRRKVSQMCHPDIQSVYMGALLILKPDPQFCLSHNVA